MVRQQIYGVASTVAISVAISACLNFASPSCVGANCIADSSRVNVPPPVPTPTPAPAGVDSSCAASCNIHSLVIDESVSVIAIGETQAFNMTPFTEVNICDANGKPTQNTKLVKTTVECDEPRAGQVSWTPSTNALEVTNLGFKADVKRRATGESTLTVSLQGKSYSRIIR